MNYINNKGAKMIFISDLEGCAPIMKTKNGEKPQSTVMCNKSFWEKLNSFMYGETNNNKIAFLGDYFDKGPEFDTTINEIIKMYEEYNNVGKNNEKKGDKKRVYILLGNRDINKLRIKYEINYAINIYYHLNGDYKKYNIETFEKRRPQAKKTEEMKQIIKNNNKETFYFNKYKYYNDWKKYLTEFETIMKNNYKTTIGKGTSNKNKNIDYIFFNYYDKKA